MSARPILAVLALGVAITAWAAGPQAATTTAPGTYCTAIPLDVTRNDDKTNGVKLPEGWVAVCGASGSTLEGTGGRPLVVACATFP